MVKLGARRFKSQHFRRQCENTVLFVCVIIIIIIIIIIKYQNYIELTSNKCSEALNSAT